MKAARFLGAEARTLDVSAATNTAMICHQCRTEHKSWVWWTIIAVIVSGGRSQSCVDPIHRLDLVSLVRASGNQVDVRCVLFILVSLQHVHAQVAHGFFASAWLLLFCSTFVQTPLGPALLNPCDPITDSPGCPAGAQCCIQMNISGSSDWISCGQAEEMQWLEFGLGYSERLAVTGEGLYLILSHLISSYLILSHLISSYLILSHLILSYLILSYLILSYLILSLI
eukprot:SAG31_NODE_251_length_19069_cov_5.843226_11_plen_227_part_00